MGVGKHRNFFRAKLSEAFCTSQFLTCNILKYQYFYDELSKSLKPSVQIKGGDSIYLPPFSLHILSPNQHTIQPKPRP